MLSIYICALLWQSLAKIIHAATITGSNGISYVITQQSNTTNLSFVVSGPTSTTGYAAVGIGSQMQGALMFVVTPLANDSATVGLRTAGGNYMPTAYSGSSPVLSNITNSGTGGTFSISFECASCASWSTGTLAQYESGDLTSMIWSAGPVSSNGNLIYHGDNYGIQQLALIQATTTTNGVTTNSTTSATTTASDSASATGSYGGLSDSWWIAHAVLVTVGFLGVYGIGILFSAIMINVKHRIKYHYIIQALGSVIGIVGVALGIKYAGSPVEGGHQTFGLVLLALVFLQAFLGTAQHLCYIKGIMSFPYVMARYAHRFLGSAFLVGVIVNAGLGLQLPQVGISTGGVVAWYVVMFLALVTFWAVRARILFKASKQHQRDTGASPETLESKEDIIYKNRSL